MNRLCVILACCVATMGVRAENGYAACDAALREDATALLTEWMDTFLDYQCRMPDRPSLDGGVLCPACARMHGRIGDAVLPLMYLADRTGDEKYLHGAERLMAWMENVHRPDGSWMNDVHVSDWNGTTVFAAIALYEALHHHGHLLSDSVRTHWTGRLLQAGEFMMDNPFIYSRKRDGMRNMNVNYSASATYALYAIGDMCGRRDFMDKACEIAGDIKAYFTEDSCFLFGEGPNIWSETKNGCRPVDLLYNVEESLPNMAQYAAMAGDAELAALIARSMRTHLEFMLPDGAWDNSWGTRSFKWTYWGGRTSDGFMGGYYLMARDNPEFIEALRRNIKLLKSATYGGLLHGGMHYHATGTLPCIHHTFGHAKALASFLEQPPCRDVKPVMTLPRDEAYGVKYFKDINTWLLAVGPWRATLTGYDSEYKVKGTHPMGGALSLLWHPGAGPVFAATMNRYTMIEAPNMQSSSRRCLSGGTPRAELTERGKAYSNLDDLDTEITMREDGDTYRFEARTHLVDANQQSPASGRCDAVFTYTYSPDGVRMDMTCDHDSAYMVLPVIASPAEYVVVGEREASVKKAGGTVSLKCMSGRLAVGPVDDDGRVFNPVPGFSFIPFRIVPDGDKKEMSVFVSYDNN